MADEPRDYPAIVKLTHRVQFAPSGQKRAFERSLQKARTASLRREIKARPPADTQGEEPPCTP